MGLFNLFRPSSSMPTTTLSRSRADTQKRFYGIRTDEGLQGLYANRYGLKLEIVSDEKYRKIKAEQEQTNK